MTLRLARILNVKDKLTGLVRTKKRRRETELPTQSLTIAGNENAVSSPASEKPVQDAPTPGTDVSGEAQAVAPPIPNHEMLRCIGRGSYGEVWLARDANGTFRAVKVVHRSSFDDSAPFDREFRGIQQYTPISRMHHGLVHILHVGSNKEQGYFFYVMELGDCEVNGQKVVPETYCAKNLASELDRLGHLSVKQCLDMAMELAEALHYLHSRQLIHRDIKPSNIIWVSGIPKFADVGLVTHVAEKGRDAAYLGTEGFVAPEGPGTPAADVYSLGKVLSEACMGRPGTPYPDSPAIATGREGDEELVQLNAIIFKACAPDLHDRYKTAAEFQADLLHLHDRLSRASAGL